MVLPDGSFCSDPEVQMLKGLFFFPDFYFPSRLDTRERAPEVVYKPENSSLSENVRQHMSAEDNKVDAVISVVGVGAILFFPISS